MDAPRVEGRRHHRDQRHQQQHDRQRGVDQIARRCRRVLEVRLAVDQVAHPEEGEVDRDAAQRVADGQLREAVRSGRQCRREVG